MNTGHTRTVIAVVAMDHEVPDRMDAPSRAVVERAASFAGTERGRLLLLLTAPVPRDILWSDASAPRVLTEQRYRLLRARRALLAEARSLFPGIDSQVRVATGSLPDAIARAVRTVDAEMVVVSDRGLGLIGQWLIGPSMSAIVRKSPAPVLIVRGSLPAKAAEHKVPAALDAARAAEAGGYTASKEAA